MIGIYKITSPSGRVYIGQSTNIPKRFNQYKSLFNCKSQVKLYRSFKKYGVDNHSFEVLIECEIKELNNLERYYQDLYNVLEVGLNCILTTDDNQKRVLSIESRQKISEKRKGKMLGIENPFYGKTHSEETKLKMSEQRKGRVLPKEWADKVRANLDKSRGRIPTAAETAKRVSSFKAAGHKPTKEHLEKMWSNSAEVNSKIVLHLQTGIYFNSATEAAENLNINRTTFLRNINGSNKTNKTGCIYA